MSCHQVEEAKRGTYPFFFLSSKVIFDVELLANLLRRLSSDHLSDTLASEIEQGLDVKKVSRQDCVE